MRCGAPDHDSKSNHRVMTPSELLRDDGDLDGAVHPNYCRGDDPTAVGNSAGTVEQGVADGRMPCARDDGELQIRGIHLRYGWHPVAAAH